ncbi:MAG: toprim domain-containing protein [Prevotella sp.]|nr:toprim domain-containing protein [Prevotella sp.]
MIDRQTIDRILDAANIVDVVSEFVTLRKSGMNYKGLCPFHDDTTPSFYVSPSRNICKCFSCGKGGTPVSFIMEHEQMTYPEALRWLAAKYHIEIHERELSSEEQQAESERESMYIVNEWAAGYFEDTLRNTADGVAYGMQYFRSRGIRDDIMRRFRLGYSLPQREALPRAAQEKGYKAEFLLKTGLCYSVQGQGARSKGQEAATNQEQEHPSPITNHQSLADRFAGRVIFPWIGMSGKVVAFGGRKLDQATKGVQQKYVNSPDSEIYHKEQQLYGIYQAKKQIAKENCVYMVEGYTDVISMHQCGLENVVANSGTALSLHQIRMLHRLTQNIVLIYDGDEAGIHAALRGTDMLLAEGMNVRVLLLPDGDDPDSFARKHTAQDFRQYIADHQTDFIVFKTRLLLKDVSDPVKRSEAVGSIVRSIAVIKDQILRDTYIHECAEQTGVAEQTLISSMNRIIYADKQKATPQEQQGQAAPAPQTATRRQATYQMRGQVESRQADIERLLIENVVRHGEEVIMKDLEDESSGEKVSLTVAQYISYDLGLDGLTLSNPLYNTILQEATDHSGEPDFNASRYFTHHSNIEVARLAATLSMENVKLAKSLEMNIKENTLRDRIIHLVLDFRMEYVKQQLRSLQQKLKEVQSDVDQMMQVMGQIKQLQEIRNVLAHRLGSDVFAN